MQAASTKMNTTQIDRNRKMDLLARADETFYLGLGPWSGRAADAPHKVSCLVDHQSPRRELSEIGNRFGIQDTAA